MGMVAKCTMNTANPIGSGAKTYKVQVLIHNVQVIHSYICYVVCTGCHKSRAKHIQEHESHVHFFWGQ
ncbi:hypothetical protein HanRHA438_Chr17g0804351 [Helianthus annuus]|nr:hypothetical protein HanRHA438_Chr17g0804351 [Helianthus annuus]